MPSMHNPPHPGEIIRELCLEPLGLSVTDAAKGLGVTRKALSELLNGHAGISPEMAIRLEQAFGSTAETWLKMQLEYDLWQAKQRAGDLKVTRFANPAHAGARRPSRNSLDR
jgi:addiction module HigA family antidote